MSIFILASGQRTGSTLLQRFLCSHPDVLIWGEHDGAVARLFPTFDRLRAWESMFDVQRKSFLAEGVNNFIPNMMPPPETIDEAERQLLRALFETPARALGRSIWGFKEVLYDATVAIRLHDLFPDARIIHLTRSIVECFVSVLEWESHRSEDRAPEHFMPQSEMWTRARTAEFVRTWCRVNESFLSMPPCDWVYPLTYERLVENTAVETRQLAEWLGLRHEQFDLSVFEHKIFSEIIGPDPRVLRTYAGLTEEERALIETDEVRSVAKQANYAIT